MGDKGLQKVVNKNGYAKHFFTYVYETDIVPRVLLLKEDLQSKLFQGLKGTQFYEWATERTLDFLKSRFEGFLSAYIGNSAAEGAVSAGGDAVSALGAWAWQEFNPPYYPFGAYFFCVGGKVHHFDLDEVVHSYMQKSKPNLDSIMNHEMKRYATALEALRGK